MRGSVRDRALPSADASHKSTWPSGQALSHAASDAAQAQSRDGSPPSPSSSGPLGPPRLPSDGRSGPSPPKPFLSRTTTTPLAAPDRRVLFPHLRRSPDTSDKGSVAPSLVA